MIILENNFIKASFSKKGAELQSLIVKKTNQEYIWNGNPDYWAKHSPILFPIVGGLKDDIYFFNGQSYHLSRHGFARDNEFEISQEHNNKLTFTFSENEKTLTAYPFRFTLKIHYTLIEGNLSCAYEVINPDHKPLLFSIGGHPAFSIPTNEDLKYSDYTLTFNNDQQLTYHKIKADLIDDSTATLELKNNKLMLSHELFYQDALVFKTLKSDQITITNSKNNHGLHFQFNNFPFFGIWAAKDADFVCLEPWCGIADGVGHNQQLTKKEGIISLNSGENWNREWTVSCF